MQRIFLVRHGQTQWNAEQRAQGHRDIALDEIGHDQARHVAKHLMQESIDWVRCSDLKRARVTAHEIAELANLSIIEDPLLRERSFGDLEGKEFHEVRIALAHAAHDSGLDEEHVPAPGGESVHDVWLRMERVHARLLAEIGNGVIVGHGGALAMLMAHLIGGGIGSARSFRLHNASVTEFGRRAGGQWVLLRYNDTDHLPQLGPAMMDVNHAK